MVGWRWGLGVVGFWDLENGRTLGHDGGLGVGMVEF